MWVGPTNGDNGAAFEAVCHDLRDDDRYKGTGILASSCERASTSPYDTEVSEEKRRCYAEYAAGSSHMSICESSHSWKGSFPVRLLITCMGVWTRWNLLSTREGCCRAFSFREMCLARAECSALLGRESIRSSQSSHILQAGAVQLSCERTEGQSSNAIAIRSSS